MKKGLKLISVIAVILCVVCGVFFGLIRFNTDTIDNLFKHRATQKIDLSTVVWTGWDFSGEQPVAMDADASVTITLDEAVEVNNLLLNGSFQRLNSMKVYVTDGNGAETEIEAKATQKNEDYLLTIRAEAKQIRILPVEEEGESFSLSEASVNPKRVHVNSYVLLVSVVAAAVLLVSIDLIVDRAEIVRELRTTIRYRHLILDLVSKDIKTKYRRSVLGLLWSVLNPLLMMLVLTAVFSTIFNFRTGDFSVYYLTGYLMFNFVTEATTFSMTSIIGAAGLIKKVYIPKFVFPLEKCLFALVNMLFSLIAAVIVFFVVGVQPHWVILLFPLPILYLFVFNFGVSLILATLNTFFRDVGYLYNVFITIWMYLTPIIYPVEILPSWLLQIVKLNPLYHYVQYFRNVTVYGVVPSLKDNLICIAFSLLFLMIGIRVFRKKQDKFIFYI